MLKKFISLLFVPMILLGAGCSKEPTLTTNIPGLEIEVVEVIPLVDGTYTLDTESSKIMWSGSKRVGATHTGLIDAQEGAAVVESGEVTGGTVEVDMRTITDSDLVDAESNRKLVGHLKSDDWFDVATYPTATFALSEVNEDAFTGTMTVKGIENEVKFPATVMMTESGVQVTGIVTLDRTLWDIRYGSGKFFDNLGDELIEDEFTLTLDLLFTAGE